MAYAPQATPKLVCGKALRVGLDQAHLLSSEQAFHKKLTAQQMQHLFTEWLVQMFIHQVENPI